MADNWTIVCFSGLDWDSHARRTHRLMSALADRGHRVIFVETIGTRLPHLSDARRVLKKLRNWVRTSARPIRTGGDLVVDSPLVPPFQHVRFVRGMGRRILARRVRRMVPLSHPLIAWTDLPMPVVRDAARSLGADLLVFDWSDDASVRVLSRSRPLRRRIAAWEDEMAKEADCVFVASRELLEKRRPDNPNAFYVAHGASAKATVEREHPVEVDSLPHPRIGFVGSVNEWTDIDLLDRMARARPSWSFVIVGPVETGIEPLRARANVLFVGRRPHEEIPSLLRQFDCGIIPYRLTPATEFASPLKLREYLEQGLPVVSVDIPDVRTFSPPVRIANGFPDFMDAVEVSLRDGPSERARRSPVRSWDECLDEMIGHIEALASIRGR